MNYNTIIYINEEIKNSMVNYKAYKIISKHEEPAFEFIIFELENYIDHGEFHGRQVKGKGRIGCAERLPYTSYRVGDWLEIDLDRIGDKSSSHIFDDTSIVRKVGSSNEIVSRNNNASVNQASGLAIQMLNRAIDSDTQNKYTASMEVDPKTGNILYHLSGQRK